MYEKNAFLGRMANANCIPPDTINSQNTIAKKCKLCKCLKATFPMVYIKKVQSIKMSCINMRHIYYATKNLPRF